MGSTHLDGLGGGFDISLTDQVPNPLQYTKELTLDMMLNVVLHIEIETKATESWLNHGYDPG